MHFGFILYRESEALCCRAGTSNPLNTYPCLPHYRLSLWVLLALICKNIKIEKKNVFMKEVDTSYRGMITPNSDKVVFMSGKGINKRLVFEEKITMSTKTHFGQSFFK